MNINKGDTLEIKKEKYDVLNTIDEIDSVDDENDKVVGEHLEISLHKFGSDSLHPTHVLKIYYNDKSKGFLLKVYQEDISKGFEKTRQRGDCFSYSEEEVISIKKITVKNN